MYLHPLRGVEWSEAERSTTLLYLSPTKINLVCSFPQSFYSFEMIERRLLFLILLRLDFLVMVINLFELILMVKNIMLENCEHARQECEERLIIDGDLCEIG